MKNGPYRTPEEPEYPKKAVISWIKKKIDEIADIFEDHENLGGALGIIAIIFITAIMILTFVGIGDAWKRYMPPGQDTVQRLEKCETDLNNSKIREEQVLNILKKLDD